MCHAVSGTSLGWLRDSVGGPRSPWAAPGGLGWPKGSRSQPKEVPEIFVTQRDSVLLGDDTAQRSSAPQRIPPVHAEEVSC